MAFPVCCFNYSAVRVPFPFGVLGRMMWNSIVPIPDHCLFIYILLLKYGFTVGRMVGLAYVFKNKMHVRLFCGTTFIFRC